MSSPGAFSRFFGRSQTGHAVNSIEVGEDGFTFHPQRGHPIEVRWEMIDQAVAYEAELYSSEVSCLDLHFNDRSKTLSLTEESAGFELLMEALGHRMPIERHGSVAEETPKAAPAVRSPLLEKAATLWPPLSAVLRVPRTEAEYQTLAGLLHDLDAEIGRTPLHPLAPLREVLALLAGAYLADHPPCAG